MKVLAKNIQGGDAAVIQVRDDIFQVPMNVALVHQVAVGQRANARQGTSSSQRRSDVTVSGRKPFTQKHTGRARQGSGGAPNLRGGGVAFGPRPRDYSQRTPKKMRRTAIKALLSQKIRDQELIVLDDLQIDNPKTADVVRSLNALGVSGSVLLVADGVDGSVIRASRNIPRLKLSPASLLNTLDLLDHTFLVITEQSLRRIEELWGGVARENEVKDLVSKGDS
jgi:large subunit ribosomal protein L4